MPLAASTEKVAVAAAACIFSKKNKRHSSLKVPRAIFPLKKNAFLIFRCRHGGFLGRPRPRRCPGPWLCGFLPWIPLWVPRLDSSMDSL